MQAIVSKGHINLIYVFPLVLVKIKAQVSKISKHFFLNLQYTIDILCNVFDGSPSWISILEEDLGRS